MAVEVIRSPETNVVEVHLSGRLHADDYDQLVPQFESAIESHGKLRLLVVLGDFDGWDVAALWEDIKFDFRHFGDFEKIAIVGHSRWHQGMAVFCKPFTSASVKYFDDAQNSAASNWLCKATPA